MNFKLSTRSIILLFWDIVATYAAYLGALLGTGQGNDFLVSTDVLFSIGLLAAVNLVVFGAFRLYNDLWEYASTSELLRFIAATSLAVFLNALISFMLTPLTGPRFPLRVFLVAWAILLVFVGGARFFYRLLHQGKDILIKRPPKAELERTLIIGAGETGSLTIKRMKSGDYSLQGDPLVVVDDDESKVGLRIHGIKVAGTSKDIPTLVKKFHITQIVMAIPSANSLQRKRIIGICLATDAHLLTMPNVRDIPIDELGDIHLKEVNLADLLGRDEIQLNTRIVSSYIAGKVILITGGGGSIGSELARQVALAAPKTIVIFDIYENTAYELYRELIAAYDDIDVRVEIGSIRDAVRLERLFSTYHPEVVFHAAAHKHVPLMEASPREAVLNNVFGTMSLCQVSERYEVDRFIFISTDKAVNPTNVMGATKRMGEMIIQYFSAKQDVKTVYAAVRFGNVLGSHGSVIPLFKRQIEAGGPVTVTHPEITRYFMTIPEASALVVMAGSMAVGGEIFVLNMGDPVKIVDLARNLIHFSGLRPGEDIEVVYTGLRPGEKLYEELLMDSETTIPTRLEDIHISTEKPIERDEVSRKLSALEEAIDGTNEQIKHCLSEQVPTYHPERAGIAEEDSESE